MKIHELREVQERIDRALAAVSVCAGKDWSQSYTFESGEPHEYRLRGIKSLVQFEDELLNAFVWIWSMKDYLKEEAARSGKIPEEIERIASATTALKLVSDIANGAKHGSLNKSRSGSFASLGNIGVSIPQEAIGSIKFGAFDVLSDIKRPELAEFRADVCSHDGKVLGGAISVLQEAIGAWERDAIPYLESAQQGAAVNRSYRAGN
ncbi:hypothetical protein J8402_12280 [Chromohalobacter israelensis]|uniref:hypothetical protein n=1 Tax=Chromohalobacter israelensis TaxID=141390 RepID=UPI003AF6FF85